MFVTLHDCIGILLRYWKHRVQRYNTLDNIASIEVTRTAARKKNQFRVNGGEAAPPDLGGVK